MTLERHHQKQDSKRCHALIPPEGKTEHWRWQQADQLMQKINDLSAVMGIPARNILVVLEQYSAEVADEH